MVESYSSPSKKTIDGFVNLDTIRSIILISDVRLFPIYLTDLYKDLVDRAESNKTHGISRVTFYDYIKLPVFMSDKLFNSLDKDNDDYLNREEFVKGLNLLYYGNFSQNSKLIFNMYDFDKDGRVVKEDIKALMSYIPLKEEEKQLESLKEIDDILSKIKIEGKINYEKFVTIIKNVTSDIYLQVLCYLYECNPFSVDNIEACQHHPSFLKLIKNPNRDENDFIDSMKSPMIIGKRSSMNLDQNVTVLSPSKTIFKSYINNEIDMIKLEEFKLEDEVIEEESDIRLPLNIKKKDPSLLKKEKANDFKPKEMVRISNFNQKADVTPTKFLLQDKNKLKELDVENFDLNTSPQKKTSTFNINAVKKKSSNLILEPKFKTTNLNGKFGNSSKVTKQGVIYKVTESKNLKTYYLSLVNKDIYYYKYNTDNTILEGMRNLSGSYILEQTDQNSNDKKFATISVQDMTLFPFSIVFSHKTRTYYVDSKEEVISWIDTIKLAIGYQQFSDVYEFTTNILGEGKFGLVKLGIHKKSKEKVAIKIIKKLNMSHKDLELVKSEIDIMKKCKHPNIVRLLDHFESNDYTFIVMEYLSGNTFAHYLENSPIDALTEKDCAKITFMIASALQYLHTFGIVHRDLKPENIMIKGSLPYESMDSIKLMDFGLSKILGPHEKVNDGFGTLTYVAPEVLTRKPYNKSVDIWSLGVIVYYTLSGTFPFDDQSNNEEIIAKKTVFQELKFNHKSWSTRTASVRDFILETMTKEMDKRIKIDDVINHLWFSDCGVGPHAKSRVQKRKSTKKLN